jgi:hypothetical protein
MASEKEFQVSGKNANALFSLKLHRGEGMALVAMNWKAATPPRDLWASLLNTRNPAATNSFR